LEHAGKEREKRRESLGLLGRREGEKNKERSWAGLSLGGPSKEWERERRRDGPGLLERRDFFFQN
jgi:hypothetical protein